jgi:DNA-directed RNA polymerase alpha subunit
VPELREAGHDDGKDRGGEMNFTREMIEAAAKFVLDVQDEVERIKKEREERRETSKKFWGDFRGTNGVGSLDLSTRAENALERNKIATIDELRRLTEYQLKKLEGVGDTIALEITNKLERYSSKPIEATK